MKKIFCLCFASIFLLLTAGCTQPSSELEVMDEDIVLPPTRFGTDGEVQGSLAKSYTFDSAFAEADAVAHIRVGNWLSEDTWLTYYLATTVRSYKGDLPESFTLNQDGNSAYTVMGYPLFTHGNELFVFLKKDPQGYEDGYWIIGAFTTLLDVAYDEAGELYYLDRYGILGETMDVDGLGGGVSTISALSICIEDEVLYSDDSPAPAHIFSAQDMNALIERQQETA